MVWYMVLIDVFATITVANCIEIDTFEYLLSILYSDVLGILYMYLLLDVG